MPHCLLTWITAVLLALGAPRGGAADADAEIKRIAARVNAVEAQLDRAVFYEQKTEDAAAGSSLTEQAWFTEAGDWLKVSQDRVSKSGRELMEMWFQKANGPTFRLKREETPAADGGTRVQESRRYYDEDSLIRELTKDAVFKADEPLETKPIKNVTRAVAKLSEEERRRWVPQVEAEKIIARLVKAGPAKRDPAAGDPGDSKRFRLIKDSTSPDGRYAVAIGLEPREEELGSYVVDLTTHRIVGEAGGRHGSWEYFWSPDSRWLVQVVRDKWSGRAAALAMDPEKGVVASSDLTAEANDGAIAFLKAKKDRTLKRLGTKLSVLIHRAEVTNDGTVTVALILTDPENPKSFESPSLLERLRVKQSGTRVEVKFLDARYE